MKDCLSLVRISNELWIFVNGNEEQLDWSSFPEGVIVELILWCFLGNKEVKLLCLEKVLRSLGNGDSDYQGLTKELSLNDLSSSFETNHFNEMVKYLKEVITHLRQVVLIDIKDVDFKYADWIRTEAYRTQKVPLIPQNVIPYWLYERHSRSGDYQTDLYALEKATLLIWAVYRSRDELLSLQGKYANRKEEIELHFIPVQKFGIPKYSDPASWSITTKEYYQNIEILRKRN